MNKCKKHKQISHHLLKNQAGVHIKQSFAKFMTEPPPLSSLLKRIPSEWAQVDLILKNDLIFFQKEDFEEDESDAEQEMELEDEDILKLAWNDILQMLQIHHWDRIKRLCLSIDHNFNLKTPFWDLLNNGIVEHFKNLEKLELTLFSCSSLQDSALESLSCSLFRTLRNLKEFSLVLSGCYGLTKEGIIALAKQIKWLENLKRFKVQFSQSFFIDDKSLVALSNKTSRYLRNLEYLAINFSWCQRLGGRGVRTLLVDIISRLSSLKNLELNFKGARNLTAESFKMGQLTKSLPHLKTLYLNFSNCKIHDEGLEALGLIIARHFTQLEWLEFEFMTFSDGLVDRSYGTFIQCISKQLINLKTLKLNFGGSYNLDDGHLAVIGSEICNNLLSLRYLDLNLPKCNKITTQGLEVLANHLNSKTPQLKQIELKLFGSNQISEEDKKRLAGILNSIPHLWIG